MSDLKSFEKKIFEKLFNRNGYVLDFNDRTFAEFFREHHIDINDKKYLFNGPSKMKRLRAFWEVESNSIVGKVLEALLNYADEIDSVDEKDKQKAIKIVHQLQGKAQPEDNFLKKEFKQIDWQKLNIENEQLEKIIKHRVSEIQNGLRVNMPLSVIFLCGSTLEGLLLDIMTRSQSQQRFNQSKSSPKDNRNGRVKKFQDWSLKDMIDVAYEVGLLDLDVKKHSHTLRYFRNYIHPLQQALSEFRPDIETAKISWQVLQAAISQITKNQKNL